MQAVQTKMGETLPTRHDWVKFLSTQLQPVDLVYAALQPFCSYMNDFHWLPLRLNILPLIHKQTHHLLDRFLIIRAQVMEGDILSLQTIIGIGEVVEQRLAQIDAFYVKNAKDTRTKYLYTVRAVLVHILQGCRQFDKFNVEQPNEGGLQLSKKVQQTANRYKHSPSPSPKSSRGKNKSPRNKYEKPKKTFYNQTSVNKRLYQASKPTGNKSSMTGQKSEMRLSDLRKANASNKSKTPRKNQHNEKAPKGSFRKVQAAQTKSMREQSETIRRIQQQKRENMQRMKDSEGMINKSMRDLSQLVFTIKMTKEEYNQFMKLKRSNNHA